VFQQRPVAHTRASLRKTTTAAYWTTLGSEQTPRKSYATACTSLLLCRLKPPCLSCWRGVRVRGAFAGCCVSRESPRQQSTQPHTPAAQAKARNQRTASTQLEATRRSNSQTSVHSIARIRSRSPCLLPLPLFSSPLPLASSPAPLAFPSLLPLLSVHDVAPQCRHVRSRDRCAQLATTHQPCHPPRCRRTGTDSSQVRTNKPHTHPRRSARHPQGSSGRLTQQARAFE